MRTLVPPIAAVLLGLFCAAPAQAEKWMWFQIKGGAVAYDADSRKTDVEKGTVGADTLIYYDRPKSVAEGQYSFVAERLEFECRDNRHRWQRSAVLDAEGRIVLARPDGDWEPMPKELGSTALFARMLCLSQDPPGGREASDLTSVMASMRAGAAGATALASLAFPAPRVVPAAPAPPAPSPAPRAAAPADAIGAVIAAAPAVSPGPVASDPAPKVLTAAPPVATVDAAVAARSLGPTIAAPSGSTPYAVADRCLYMKEGRDMTSQFAFNDCSYRVNYAWCVAGSNNPRAECGGPTIARGAGAVAPKSNAASTYPGGLGRLHIFACRAPGSPVVTQADGKLTHQCLGPAPTTSAAASAPVAKAQPKLPELRRLTP